MAVLSERLATLTGWRVVPVTELVPDEVFFDHLANKRFPAGAFIRPEEEMDYLKEPDIFHDIFGHVPLLANPVYSDFMVAYGKGRKARAGAWATAQSGAALLVHDRVRPHPQPQGPAHLRRRHHVVGRRKRVRAWKTPRRMRVAFDLERVMRTGYIIDDFQ